jgi:hypothetical protein
LRRAAAWGAAATAVALGIGASLEACVSTEGFVREPVADAASPEASQYGCPASTKECRGACVDIEDPAYGCGAKTCDACNLAKTASYKCKGTGGAGSNEGVCGVDTCFTRYASCDNQDPNGCEADLRKVDNCGACGTTCTASEYCNSYSASISCVPICPPGAMVCTATRQCINPSNDIANCGGCGNVCPAPPGTIPKCENGSCGFTCDTSRGFHLCNGVCVQDSVSACGQSCAACTADDPYQPVCQNGACAQQCKYPLCNGQCRPPPCNSQCQFPMADCDDNQTCETNLAQIPNCGACGEDCDPSPISGGVGTCAPPGGSNPNYHCTYSCPPNKALCSGSCVPTTSNPNCGMCGRDCHATCNAGSCQTDCLSGWGDCNQNPADGCEQFLSNNGPTMHCGTCNRQCMNCMNGICLDTGADAGPTDSGGGKDAGDASEGGL